MTEWKIALVVANRNTPRQSVLSGGLELLAEAEQRLNERGVQTKKIEVATAFHSPFVASAATGFREFLSTCSIEKTRTPFYPNNGGEPLLGTQADTICDMLAEQIAMPVRFVDMVRRMHDDGFRTFLEVGPGSVLTSFVRSILEGLPHRAIATDRAGQHGLTALWHALGPLAAAGVQLNWKSLREGYDTEEKATHAGTPRFTMSIHGGNYGRPYPPPGGSSALPKPVAAKQVPQPSAPGPAANTAGSDALEAYRVFQETISNAHRTWQEHLAKGHADVIRALESAYFTAVGQPSQVPTQVSTPAPVFIPPRVFIPVPAATQPAPVTAMPAPIQAPLPAPPSVNIRELLLSVVAEKTGYPASMLEPGMALEADLGIDSIKRVEIFSAIEERLPGAIQFEPAAIAELRTLGDIIQRLESLAPQVVPTPPTATPEVARVTERVTKDDEHLVLSLISEKTGYPVEMLNPEMALEADLGIDSIKRVEIFSALQDRRPDVPEDTAGMARLGTIADVIAFMKSAGRVAEPAPSTTLDWPPNPRRWNYVTQWFGAMRPPQAIICSTPPTVRSQ
jgi:malonyl CoA-acyl carrier protein transacylase/acyl carrier protein